MNDQQPPAEPQDPYGRPQPPATHDPSQWAPPPASPSWGQQPPTGGPAGWDQPPHAQPYPQYAPQPQPDTGATTALIFGILSLILCPIVLSIPAIIIGKNAERKALALPGQPGLGSAKAGYVLGWISIALTVGLILLFAILGAAGSSEY